MYKKILTIFALAASLLACNKVENEVVAPENGAKTLTITATIGDPDTRLSYSEATDGSYKASFNNDDVVWAYFAKADNSVAGPVTNLPSIRNLSLLTVRRLASASPLCPSLKAPQRSSLILRTPPTPRTSMVVTTLCPTSAHRPTSPQP